MANAIIVGMQWGDEGKGKIVDLLCPAFDVVARYQGGHNAGHTVKFGDRHFSLNLIPSGILHPKTQCILGTGMVISPEAFFSELERLREAGVSAEGRLFVSQRAHVLLPPHAALDQARETARGADKIGTTGRGIGVAYELKAGRIGLRMCDLFASDLEARLRVQLARLEPELLSLGAEPPGHPGRLADLCRSWRSLLKPFLRDTELLLHEWIVAGKAVLFEGAQGTLLDLDHGTFPYVTSSSAAAGGACTGTGVPPTAIAGAIGVLKAYTTRVGGGPFPTELNDAVGTFLRDRGNEYGTVTRRPRRCGWLDLPAARYARMLNGIDTIALTKLDVLDDLETIRVCVGYRYQGEVLAGYPADVDTLQRAEPLYQDFPGWKTSTVGLLRESSLPKAARDYVSFLEAFLEVRVSLLSTGPRREETLVRIDPELERLTSGRLARVLAEQRPA
jgi:adenylosuccinate synthase